VCIPLSFALHSSVVLIACYGSAATSVKQAAQSHSHTHLNSRAACAMSDTVKARGWVTFRWSTSPSSSMQAGQGVRQQQRCRTEDRAIVRQACAWMA
jgi:hypothetical protein